LTSSCQKTFKKKRGFAIGISFPKIFWHLETKKKELPIIHVLFLKKLAQIYNILKKKRDEFVRFRP
jgi:hypothetical protein